MRAMDLRNLLQGALLFHFTTFTGTAALHFSYRGHCQGLINTALAQDCHDRCPAESACTPAPGAPFKSWLPRSEATDGQAPRRRLPAAAPWLSAPPAPDALPL